MSARAALGQRRARRARADAGMRSEGTGATWMERCEVASWVEGHLAGLGAARHAAAAFGAPTAGAMDLRMTGLRRAAVSSVLAAARRAGG